MIITMRDPFPFHTQYPFLFSINIIASHPIKVKLRYCKIHARAQTLHTFNFHPPFPLTRVCYTESRPMRLVMTNYYLCIYKYPRTLVR